MRQALPDATRETFLRGHPSPVYDINTLEQQQAQLLKQQESDLRVTRQRPPTGRRRHVPAQQSVQSRPGTAQSGVDFDNNLAHSTLIRVCIVDP